MKNTPGVKTPSAVFDDPKQAKKILRMTREELEVLPAAIQWLRVCYHPPSTHELRLHCLDALAGTYGVEGAETPEGWLSYLNAGDTYAVTLVCFRGRYRVCTVGDMLQGYM